MEKNMKRIILAVALAVPFVAAASDDLNCSIKAKKLTSKAELTAMAKVTDADARRRPSTRSAPRARRSPRAASNRKTAACSTPYDVKTPGKKASTK